MKSSIFTSNNNNNNNNNTPPPTGPRHKRLNSNTNGHSNSHNNTTTTTTRRLQSSSPYINNSKPNTPNLNSTTTKTLESPALTTSHQQQQQLHAHSKRHNPKQTSNNGNTTTWNLDNIISQYNSIGKLPPLLSPTLPDSFGDISVELDNDDIPIIGTNEIIPDDNDNDNTKKLSAPKPTYPMQSKRMINDVNSDMNSSDDDDDDDVPIRRLKHRRFSNDDKSLTKPKQKEDRKVDEMPLSMLSPTLPLMFRNLDHDYSTMKKVNALPSLSTTSTNNGHSAPINNSSKSTSTSTNGSAPSFFNIQTKVGTFKWIDKSNDPNKPKFILRMTVNNKMKYKKYFNKITSPLQLTGFKISSSKDYINDEGSNDGDEEEGNEGEEEEEEDDDDDEGVLDDEDDDDGDDEIKKLISKPNKSQIDFQKKRDKTKQMIRQLKEESESLSKNNQLQEQQILEKEKMLKELKAILAQKNETLKHLEQKLNLKNQEQPSSNPKSDTKSDSRSNNNESPRRSTISDEMRRRELHKLTEDIMRKQSTQSSKKEPQSHPQSQSYSFKRIDINKFIITPTNFEKSFTNLTNSQREDIKFDLQNKKSHWFQLSKITQQKSDECFNNLNITPHITINTTRNPHIIDDLILSMIIQIDSFLLRMVSNDFDERSKIISGVLPSERSWKLLDQDIENFITKIDNHLKLQHKQSLLPPNRMFGDFCTIINCIMFQTRALIMKRINSILTSVIQLYIDKRNHELNLKIIELQQLSINNNLKIIEFFMNSNPSYLNDIIPIKFPKSWGKKCLNLQIVQQRYNLLKFDENLIPNNQIYYLPLGNYSNLNELTGFLFNIINEFMDIYNNFHKYNGSKKITYTLQSGQQ